MWRGTPQFSVSERFSISNLKCDLSCKVKQKGKADTKIKHLD